ncbi:pantothenate synthetase [Cantharellus anzutake]|uniref:pantothenate synthetase n=1 Tax=Cantharellus anzutake TaxID=1750568 RepID=UPI00190496E3|nr:pantothenate synthetase [Cantharellus anzutake]KAF8313314.1 pantothenate synthetase [Cantharellus anzutake]
MPASLKIPVLPSVKAFREWRQSLDNRSIGFVPTMGALHDGHMKLVDRSLSENSLTVVSIFVNPAQFAPHEDLSSYPRTFDGDMRRIHEAVGRDSIDSSETPKCAVFLPTVEDMYPSGIVQNIEDQKGTFVQVKGYEEQMEGKSRPKFFRGVATIVTKLFSVVQPTRAYFGQKDIQQGLLLRRMVRDLLISHPLPENLIIVPTQREKEDFLALSSRNAYLTSIERPFAPTLYQALTAGRQVWEEISGSGSREGVVAAAREVIKRRQEEAIQAGVEMRFDYVEVNDPDTFDVVNWRRKERPEGQPVIISGALWIGRTRLIDNLLSGDTKEIFNQL